MRLFFPAFALMLHCSNILAQDDAFISTWNTELIGQSCNSCVEIHSPDNDFDIDWNNDGIYDEIGRKGQNLHDYNQPGIYVIRIKKLKNLSFGRNLDANKIININQWGTTKWQSLSAAFQGSKNLQYNAIDTPDLSEALSIRNIFYDSNFNSPINHWDVSNISDFFSAFGNSIFNQPLDLWNISKAKDISYMFYNSYFNQSIENWDVSNVEYFYGMFQNSRFNQPLNKWKTLKGLDFGRMFYNSKFNQDISSWQLPKAISLSEMFAKSNFNQAIGTWDVSNVTKLTDIFKHSDFNQPIGYWNLSKSMSFSFDSTKIECSKYHATLKTWADNLNTPLNVTISAKGQKYNAEIAKSRSKLINLKNWKFIGDVSSSVQPCLVIQCSSSSKLEYKPMTGPLLLKIKSNVPSEKFEILYKKVTETNYASITLGSDTSAVLYLTPAIKYNVILKIYCSEGLPTTKDYIIEIPKLNQASSFITTWRTDNIGTSCKSCITIPILNEGLIYNYNVDWDNDGVFDEFNITESITHDFGSIGHKTIRISGNFPAVSFNDSLDTKIISDAQKLIVISQWGTTKWKSFKNSFYGCINLISIANDQPDLSEVSDMSYAFAYTKFNGLLDKCNVSKVTNMKGLFAYSIFNNNIGTWKTDNVTDMSYLFFSSIFNKPLSWNTSKVVNMAFMFAKSSFNQYIQTFNVAKVENMEGMFSDNTVFNGSLATWNLSLVKNTAYMFARSIFNQSLASWNVSKVQNMEGMFLKSKFNNTIGNWNVSSVVNMKNMFKESVFNSTIENWAVVNAKNMSGMFYLNKLFNKPLGKWNVSKLENMSGMFYGATFFNQNIGNWNVSNVVDMSYMFYGAINFNQNIGNWNVSNVVDMSNIFNGTNFNSSISKWNVSKVENMNSMFSRSIFNQDIKDWKVTSVKDMSYMFNSSKFTGNIEKWDVSSVTTMEGMFLYSVLNSSIENWNVSNVKNFNNMFRNSIFNNPIGKWNTSKAENMGGMFYQSIFNQPIGNWNISNVTSLWQIFCRSKYNHDLGLWDLSKVKDMESMFYKSEFNKPINNWNVSNALYLHGVFEDCKFNQPIDNWVFNKFADLEHFFDLSSIDCNNYSTTLKGWASNPLMPKGLMIGAQNVSYGTDAKSYRDILTQTKKWTINNDKKIDSDCIPAISNQEVKIRHIKNEDTDVMLFYPNPAENYIVIESSNQRQLRFISIEGRVIYSITVEAGFNKLDISSLNSGMYFISYDNGRSKKLIVK